MHVQEPECGDPLRLPLQLERLDGLDVDVVADEPVRQLSEQHLARAGGLLEARRGVDRVAGDEPLPRGRIAGDDLSRIDAGAVRERDAVRALESLVQPGERLLHSPGRADRAQRVVLVHAREPEHGHHRVADELLDRAAVARDLGAHRVEVAGHRLAQRLGVELLAEARRSLQVAEENRDELSHLLRRYGGRERRSAEAAQAELRGIFLPAIWAKLHVNQCRAPADLAKGRAGRTGLALASDERETSPVARYA